MRRRFLENPKMRGKFLEDMSWSELKQASERSGGIVIIPTGSIEQHGHLPLRTDCYGAEGTVRKIAEKLDDIVIAPVIPYGFSAYHQGFPGTLSLKFETTMNLYRDICEGLRESGFNKFLFITGHEGNGIVIWTLGRELRAQYGVLVVMVAWYYLTHEAGEVARNELQLTEGHSGVREASMLYSQLPSDELERIRKKDKQYISYGKKLPWGTDNMVNPTWEESGHVKVDLKTSIEGDNVFSMRMAGGFRDVTPYGHIGDPGKATVELGEKFNTRTANHAIKVIEEMRKIEVPLEEPKPRTI